MPALATSTRTRLATATALVGFAANSLLCRAALGHAALGAIAIDAWSFTAVRLCTGALTLALLARLTRRAAVRDTGSNGSALALYVYAAAFSLAYLRLAAGVGALVLFGCVQATMIGWSMRGGARPTRLEWSGLVLALLGLAWLTLPGASAPDPFGVALMAAAGIAWGVYSLRGRTNRAPLAATGANFARSVPLALLALLLAWSFASLHATTRGLVLASASGALASGLGYSLWYLALPGLLPMQAALLQLVVPVLTGCAGIVVLGESPSWRLALAGALILGGVSCAVLGRTRR